MPSSDEFFRLLKTELKSTESLQLTDDGDAHLKLLPLRNEFFFAHGYWLGFAITTVWSPPTMQSASPAAYYLTESLITFFIFFLFSLQRVDGAFDTNDLLSRLFGAPE